MTLARRTISQLRIASRFSRVACDARRLTTAILIGLLLATSASAQEIMIHSAAATSQPVAVDEPYSYTKILLAMVIVVGLIVALKWAAGRFVPGVVAKSTRAISVVSRQPMGPRQQLILVKVGRRAVLVASSNAQVNTLCEITDPDELAQLIGQIESEKTPAPVAGAFAKFFTKKQQDFEPTQQDVAWDRQPAEEDRSDDQIDAARQELSGLAQRVRLLSRSFTGSQTS